MPVSDLLARWRARLTRDRGTSGPPVAAEPPEQDVGHDPGVVNSRPVGGEHTELTGDTGSVTGTGRTGMFVGQIAGDDLGYAGETGAERRARAHSSDADADADADSGEPGAADDAPDTTTDPVDRLGTGSSTGGDPRRR